MLIKFRDAYNLLNFSSMLLFVKIVSLLFFLQSCKSNSALLKKETTLVDTHASRHARFLFNKIKMIPKQGYAFGHQDATAYGIGWKNNGKQYQSDVYDVTGDYPAVYGFEIGHIELGHAFNLDTVNFKMMKKLIRKAHKKGGIITISWHPNNPVSGKSAWDTIPAVEDILSGGVLHAKYKDWLLKVANFLNHLRTSWGQKIPVVFRPYHEMNGSWFWWGKDSCSPQQYRQLWIETVKQLKTYKVNNVLFAYSPNKLKDKADYLKYYPGDEYVDILGIDIYQHTTTEDFIKAITEDIAVVKNIALEKNKPFVLSEAGLNKVAVTNWWVDVLDKHIANTGISWALFWRNAWPSHYFVPYPGHKNASDFKAFKNLSHVLFLEDIKKVK
ncbi:hypothetical protein D1816_19000 [Aquimarina sp. AD10]|nr:hypothetical protein D1816_19000 [Aquimarina sp. AD10]RKM90441.1 hypothetical protein D7033_23380 [Aquimarina sp. AD10]